MAGKFFRSDDGTEIGNIFHVENPHSQRSCGSAKVYYGSTSLLHCSGRPRSEKPAPLGTGSDGRLGEEHEPPQDRSW